MKSIVWWTGMKQYVCDLPFAKRRELKKEIAGISFQIKTRKAKIKQLHGEVDWLNSQLYERYRCLEDLRRKNGKSHD